MIHVNITRDADAEIDTIKLSFVGPAIDDLHTMVNKALNCWPDSPAQLKDLGDMLTHGRITQDHTLVKMNTKQNSDYYTPLEQLKIQGEIEKHGEAEWREQILSGEAQKKIAALLK